MGLLVSLNVIIRLPHISHERGVDSFFVHALSTSISSFGSAKWIIHPTSFFGLYPYSYPSAQPFILSGLSQSLGISLEHTILLFSIFLGLLGMFTSYILAKEIFNDDVYSILISFFYSLSPVFINYTYWEASTRSMFLAILPLVLWLFIRHGYKYKVKYIFMLLLVSVFLLATHRTAIFLVFVTFGYLVSLFSSHLFKEYLYRRYPKVANVHFTYLLLIISFLLFLVQFSEFAVFSLKDYTTGYLYTGNDFIKILLNMSADYVGKMGIALLFVIVGFIKLLSKERKNVGEAFILLNVIIFLPLMGLENYSPLILSPFLIISGAVGVFTIIDIFKKWKMSAPIILFICIISSVVFSFYMISHWDLNEDSIYGETVASAAFVKERCNGTVVANTGDLASKMTSFSTVPTIPLGGPYAIAAPPNQLSYSFINQEDIDVRPLRFSELKPSSDTLYAIINSPSNNNIDWRTIMANNYWNNESRNLYSKYNIGLVIESGYPSRYLYWSWRPSNLLISLKNSGNKIYSNNMETIYSIPYQ